MLNSRKLAVAATVATALVLSGCAAGSAGNDGNDGMSGMNHGTDDAATGSPADDFNSADVMFAQVMIPHHEQAVEMSDLLLAKSGLDDRVIDLANQIKRAQQPEIDQLRDWLGEWGEDESGAGDMGDMDHGGMMSDDDMTALENAEGAEASRLFLEQMIVHHEGAIDMAKAEIADGEHEDATAMAEAIIAAQTAEIATMQQLLTSR